MPKDAFDGLEADILRDGYVRDKLVVWEEEGILVDGHNRWKVITSHPDVLDGKYEIEYKSFTDRYAVIAWICANQLHKHNLNELQQAKLIQEEYEARQKSYGGDRGNQYTKVASDKTFHLANENLIDGEPIQFEYKTGKEPKTREIIAKEHHISTGAVQTAVEVGRGIDRAEEVEPGFKNKVLSGELKVSKQDLKNLRNKTDDEEVKSAIEEMKKPKSKPQRTKEQREEDGKTNAIIQESAEAIRGESRHQYTLSDALDELVTVKKEFISKVRNVIEIRHDIIKGSDLVKNEINTWKFDIENLKGEI